MNDNRCERKERGIALVTVVFVLAILFAIALAVLFQGRVEHVVAVNEMDHMKTLAYAEAGLAWATRQIIDTVDYSVVLAGPTGATGDDNLLGLRGLGLTATSQFTLGNEAVESALLTRDFGEGARTWEVIRVADEGNRRALVWVRVDDNYDDDQDDPSGNDPLVDKDDTVVVTVVAEYPIFVDSSGTEIASGSGDRGIARRTLRAEVGGGAAPTPAIAVNGDINVTGTARVCGECGDVHTNQDGSVLGTWDVCGDATAVGNLLGSIVGILGRSGGGYPVMAVPVINPYDDLFVPEPAVFDTTGSPATHLQCADPATAWNNAKYYALVADSNKGKIFKAYWDAVNVRWEWKEVDDLAGTTNIRLDDCGRVQGETGTGTTIDDGEDGEFYGFRMLSGEGAGSCAACGTSGEDVSLCDTSNNDFNVSGYYHADTDAFTGSVTGSNLPALPGSYEPNASRDLDPASRVTGGVWDYPGDTIWSPLQNAVVFVYGNLRISGSPGSAGSLDYCNAAGCSATVPAGRWQTSFIVYGDIEVTGNPSIGPANPDAGFHYQFIAGRDIKLYGNMNAGDTGCSGTCPGTSPADIDLKAGVIAAHEQIDISGDKNIFGFMLAEDASDCSNMVDGAAKGISRLSGSPNVLYDCNHPPNPWAAAGDVEVKSWQELP